MIWGNVRVPGHRGRRCQARVRARGHLAGGAPNAWLLAS